MKSKVIGLTGQTGAGKSTAAKTAEEMGCYVINADLVAREAVEKGSECLKRLAEQFGCDIIDSDGSCNRRLLAKRAFSSAENTEKLNQITHPWIIRRIDEYIEAYRQKNGGMIVLDAPQLFESGADSLCNMVIAVTAPQDIRLDRIMQRDHLSREEALLRIRAQHEQHYYIERADAVIDGSLPMEQVRRSIADILLEICRKEG